MRQRGTGWKGVWSHRERQERGEERSLVISGNLGQHPLQDGNKLRNEAKSRIHQRVGGKAGWWEHRGFSFHCVAKCGNVTSNLRCFLSSSIINHLHSRRRVCQSGDVLNTSLMIIFKTAFNTLQRKVGGGVHLKFDAAPNPSRKEGVQLRKVVFSSSN